MGSKHKKHKSPQRGDLCNQAHAQMIYFLRAGAFFAAFLLVAFLATFRTAFLATFLTAFLAAFFFAAIKMCDEILWIKFDRMTFPNFQRTSR